jgi:hypothetical protein
MGKERTLYKRRLSLDEAKERYVLISKDALSMFPRAGKVFNANFNGNPEEMSVEAVLCTCRGPDSPHDHYHLSFADLKSQINVRRGSIASVRKESDNYRIEVG